jgi:hypothetical protein
MNVGTHAALAIVQGSQSTLYDPAGSYSEDHQFGSGDMGDGTIADFVKYHTGGGSAVDEIHFNTSPAEEAAMLAQAQQFGNASAGQCAQATSTAMSAAAAFKGLGTYTLPGRLEDAAKKIRSKQPGSDNAVKSTPAAAGSNSGDPRRQPSVACWIVL